MSNFDLFTLGGDIENFENFTVTPFANTDVFEFDIFGSRDINIHLHNLVGGDADVRLFRDVNNNDRLDAADVQVAASLRFGTADDSLSYAAGPGTYFARVNRFSGGNITYDLDVVATRDLGVLGNSIVSRNFDLFPSDPGDTFEFDIFGTRDVNLNLHNISPGDDADLRLYRDTNNNRIFDSDDVLVASSVRGSNADDSINRTLTTGTYFAQVLRFSPGSNGVVDYDLDLSATSGGAPSNQLPNEFNFGNLSGDRTRFGAVNNNNTSDTYRFALSAGEEVDVRLTGLSADADVRVIRDLNNNQIVDPGEVVGSSVRGGNLPEFINNVRGPGNYFVQVYQFSGSTNYNLQLDHSPIDRTQFFDLGVLGSAPRARTGVVAANQSRDIYEFDIFGVRDVNLSLNDISFGDDVDLRLYRDANGNRAFDSGDTLLASSIRGSNLDDSINRTVGTGTYFAEVRRFSGTGFASYDLDLSATSGGAPSNVLADEFNFGNLSGDRSRFGSVNNSDTSDTYRFALSFGERVNIGLSGLSADADVRVIRDFNNNRIVDAGEVVGSSIRPSNLSESINNISGPGNYFVQVYQFSGSTNYNLSLDYV